MGSYLYPKTMKTENISDLTLMKSICVDKSLPYILHISAQEASAVPDAKVALGSIDCITRIYDVQTLSHYASLEGHAGNVTGVQFANQNHNLCFTSALDATVRCWDFRDSHKKAVSVFEGFEDTPPGFTAFALNKNDKCLAAGTDVKSEDVHLLFWDTRQPGADALGGYFDSHSDTVSTIKFHETKATELLTGTEDGLVNLFDISESSEDEALLTTLNIETFVNRVGWCRPDSSQIFCLSDKLTLNVWEANDPYDDVISIDSEEVKNKVSDDVDYLIDCFEMESSSKTFIAMGNNRGQIFIHSLEEDGYTKRHQLSGHANIVRALAWDEKSGNLWTGGEDSTLCLWRNQAASQKVTTLSKVKSSTASSSAKKKTKRKSKPY
ncbi:hypothetical protein CAPTEDRAFT_192356 [Capitella teleta]|uniref:WD repeat-containing protein 89 n=1 Tax=Capitella teleta TaxID=283909 RepID=R7TDW9_CAPTE|nr:hypothetical protein CAPTEDRAFT_192356 [Capitella teleta]|eukprot:ELT89231.1 hypothetical protein CAPTEDRAFT_192356 [Capitella teleta]